MKIVAFFSALFLSVALLLTALYSVAVGTDTYEYHQVRLRVAERSLFSEEELSLLNCEVAGYLKGENELSEANFSERERMHMVDVRNLVFLCRRVMCVSWALSAIGIFAVCLREKWNASILLLRGAWQALGAMAGAILLIAAVCAVDFTWAFTLFHKILFTNDLWLLSASSTLIRMFPEDFFRAMAGSIGLRFAGMLLLALSVGKGLKYYADTRC